MTQVPCHVNLNASGRTSGLGHWRDRDCLGWYIYYRLEAGQSHFAILPPAAAKFDQVINKYGIQVFAFLRTAHTAAS